MEAEETGGRGGHMEPTPMSFVEGLLAVAATAAAAAAISDDRSTCENGLVSSPPSLLTLLLLPSTSDERSCDVKVLECLLDDEVELEEEPSSIFTREMSTLGT